MTSEQIEPRGHVVSAPNDEAVAPEDFAIRAKLAFPVVGIGASAGGVEALRGFFEATPAASGIAYVVIQHLSPDHGSLMAEILGRSTSMPVHQIEDGVRVEPNHVYVIRPGYTVTLEGEFLRLGAPVERRGHRRPVDDFFRSLAREQKEAAIAIVLSGTGTNGSAGAQAIKAAGGLCIAQDPKTADFPGMPQSLIYAGYADQVLRVEEMPSVLLRYVQHPYLQLDPVGRARAAEELEQHRQQLHDIIATVRARTKHDFSPYRHPTLLRRIQRRMGLAGVATLQSYESYLKDKSGEAEALANDLMINVTGFFRDAGVWEALREAVVRPMVEQRGSDDPIRAWVCACASGEEPYSLAMLIAEEAERARKDIDVKIFATDTADKSLALARAGVYPGGIEGDVSPERLERFFDKDEHTYRVKKTLRDQVVFAPQDLLRDPPFSRLDIVSCRNLLIYLEPEAQRRALTLLHFSLRDGGNLVLGTSETLGQADSLFEVVSKRWRIYRRIGSTHRPFVQLPTTAVSALEIRPITRVAPVSITRPATTNLIQAALLAEFGPPTAVVDANNRIVYFHGDAEAYLHHPSGETTQNLLELVRAPLRPAVRSALRQATAEERAVTVEIESQEGGNRVAVTAAPMKQTYPSGHFRVSFSQTAAVRPGSIGVEPASVMHLFGRADQDSSLEEEVTTLRRELQATVEAFEAANEELKASNEEGTSTNEELQSANEELETGKEELQSLNEELITVNAQLHTKVIELEALTNDLDNLLSSTDIAVLFLDPQLNVRRFTPAMSDLIELIPADVGRPLAHFTQKFTGSDVIAEAGRVMAKLVPIESEVQSHSDRWYLRRSLPYRTQDDRIAGVVITFIDITVRKRAERTIEATQARLQAVIEQMPAAVLMVDAATGELLLANRHAAMLFNQPYPLPFIGHTWMTVHSALRGFHSDGRAFEAQDWPLARALATGEQVLDAELNFLRSNNTATTISMSASPVRDASGGLVAAVAAFWDITERKVASEALRDSEEHFRMLVESAHDYAIFMLDQSGDVVSWNQGAERVTGFSEQDILGQSGAVLFTPEDRAAGAPEHEMREAALSTHALDERWHLRKDGTRFWASGVMTAARDANGNLRGFVKIMRDQTDRKSMDARLEEALLSAQQLRARAEGANRAKDEFISTVSHELRTPLNTIRLWSRMFISGTVHGKDVVEGAKFIDRAALAQQQLIDDLLDVSRMATGQLRLNLRDTYLIRAVEGAVEAVQPLATGRGIRLVVDLSPDVGVVRVDPDRIQQVVWNLLANAVKFTPEGGRVDVAVHREGGTVEIRIKDTGVGIRAEFLAHVFDRFRQGDASTTRRYAGIGLGLAIVKQLVDLHNGTVIASSEGEGHGAAFVVYLPLERKLGALEDSALPSDGPSAKDLTGVEILLAEDETMARAATERLLEQYGAQVRASSSAAGAREAFEIRRPDVIVADIGMPGEDGNELLASIRNIEREQKTARIPAVAVTAFARAEDRDRAIAAGFDAHLPKPVDPDRLVAVIGKLLEAVKARSEQ